MNRAEKTALIDDLHATFTQSEVVLVAHYKGLTVAEMSDLRRKMRAAGGTVKVAKNRLARLALDGTPYQDLNGLMIGPTALTYANDPVGVSKVAVDFAKTNPKLVLIGGGVGNTVLDPDGIKSLATLPPLQELRAKIVGLLSAPATRMAGVLQAPAGQLARVFAAYGEKAGGEGEEAVGEAEERKT